MCPFNSPLTLSNSSQALNCLLCYLLTKSRGLENCATEVPAGKEGVRTERSDAPVLVPPLEKRAPPSTRPQSRVQTQPISPTHSLARPRPPGKELFSPWRAP